MRGNRNDRFTFPMWDQRPGLFAGSVITLLLVGGILSWMYMLSMEGGNSGRILMVEVIVNLLILAANIYGICRVGYDGFRKNLGVTYGLNIILTVVGFYIGKIDLLASPTIRESVLLFEFLEFVLFVLFAALMAVVPTLIICLLMWTIMALFGRG